MGPAASLFQEIWPEDLWKPLEVHEVDTGAPKVGEVSALKTFPWCAHSLLQACNSAGRMDHNPVTAPQVCAAGTALGHFHNRVEQLLRVHSREKQNNIFSLEK